MLSSKLTWRVWASAEESQPRPNGAVAPSAPFAQDFANVAAGAAQDDFKSTAQHAYATGWSEDVDRVVGAREPAGIHHRPEVTLADCVHKSQWDNPDWKGLKSTYMHHSDAKVLSRHHRRFLKNLNLSQETREARWAKCFRQSERDAGKFDVGNDQDGQSRVSGTDFSIQPAGFVPKQPSPAELHRQMQIQRGMLDSCTVGTTPKNSNLPLAATSLDTTALPSKPKGSNSKQMAQSDNAYAFAAAQGNARQGRCAEMDKHMLPRPSPRQKQQVSKTPRRQTCSKYARGDAREEPWLYGGQESSGPAADAQIEPEASSAVERRLRTMHGWDFASKIARKKKNGREPSTAWAPVGAVPYYGVPTSRK